MFCLLLIFLSGYFLLSGSFHCLMFLLLLEILVISNTMFIVCTSFTWMIMLIFLLICVCVGAYGVALLISNSRGNSFVYFLSS